MMRAAAILIALAAVTSAAYAAQPAPGPSTDREVITADNGPGHRLTIVRDGGGPGAITVAAGPEVMTYKDVSGAVVRVYADHPVNRAEVQAQMLDAERHAERARSEGRRAAEEGRQAAVQGRLQAQFARQDAARVREAGLNAAQEGRREAELARREAERARAEGKRAIEEARREMEQLRSEASSADLRGGR